MPLRGGRAAAGNNMAGSDPEPNTEEWLWVTCTVGEGSEQRARVNENEQLVLP